MKVLVVESDAHFGNAVVELLANNGYHPTWCRRGADALAAHEIADLILLNVELPDMDGFEVLGHLRRLSSAPILALAARADENSVVNSLRAGADDFVAIPVRLRELLARIDALGRRTTPRKRRGRIDIMTLTIDLDAQFVWIAGQPVDLTPTEFGVLSVLANRAGQAVSRQHIMATVWGDISTTTSNALNVHMHSLRAKLSSPPFLRTIRRYGYRLGDPTLDELSPPEPVEHAPAITAG